jgi:hypothetical protein
MHALVIIKALILLTWCIPMYGGPAPVTSMSGYRWFILFTNDCTRMTWIYLLKIKDEVSKILCNFYKMIRTQFDKEIKMVRSDNEKKNT